MKGAAEQGRRKDNKGVAIVGMACLFPGAPDLGTFWTNIVGAVDATREVTDAEWDAADFYHPDGKNQGKSYSKRGGFINEFADFDPLEYGIMPSAVAGSDPDQFLTLKVAVAALRDAGYDIMAEDKGLNRERAEIILGRISAPGGGAINRIQQSKTVIELTNILDSLLPAESGETRDAIVEQLQARLSACNPENTPGTMPNVLAGRIASKLGFRGRSMLIDAACASSMVAVETATNDLLEGRCDFAMAGGLHINSSAVLFQMFSTLGALSATDVIKPFDQDADGTLLGEGAGIVCLKRYEDAIADGNRIYAVIKGVASASDGRGGGLLAPSAEGEALAMRRAYDEAGISPSTVQLLEAHGTGTPVGDVVELEAVARIFKDGDAPAEPWCAVGSVKSMIGHCQSASAVAGIIKAALSLHHKILPPTLNVKQPSEKIDWATHPCYVNTRTRPWIIARDSAVPRRAAVSAFGFGGINGHMILEEAPEAFAGGAPGADDTKNLSADHSLHEFDSEVFTFFGKSKIDLIESLGRVSRYIEKNSDSQLKDLAYSANCIYNQANSTAPGAASADGYRLALVTYSVNDLFTKLMLCSEYLSGRSQTLDKDAYYSEPGTLVSGKLAYLYPGLGSAYTNMLGDLCMYFPEVREVFEIVDSVALAAGATEAPSKSIFPAPFDKGKRAVPTLLASADFAVVAVLLAEYSMYQLLMHLGIKPDVIMGCSTGEFAAITTTGSVDVLAQAKTFYKMSTQLARSIPQESLDKLRTLRVLSSWEKVSALATGPLYLSADLGDSHILVTGDVDVINALTLRLKEERIGGHALPVPIPYHTPLVASMIDANDQAVKAVDIQPLTTPGWSCSTAGKYPQDVETLRKYFVELFTKPIALRQTVQAMHDDGVRIFVEVGPNGILTSSLDSILKGKPHVAVPSNLASRSGLAQIHHLLAVLYTQAVPANFAFLYKRRGAKALDFNAATVAKKEKKFLSTAYPALKIDVEQLPQLKASRRRTRRADLLEAGPESDYESDYEDEYGDEYEDDDNLEAGDNFAPSEPAVLQTFLSNNAEFYARMNAMTEQVMQSYMDGVQATDEDGCCDDFYSRLPFLSTARISHDGDNTQVEFDLDLSSHLYLLDHAIGGPVSTVRGTRVHLVPLMVTLEIMAEAAFAHMEDGIPVRVEQVKAFRRIVVDHQGLTLKALVYSDGDKAKVSLYDAADPSTLLATADFIFAAEYPGPQNGAPGLSVGASAPPERLTDSRQFYGSEPLKMFHGQSMQAVKTVEKVGNRTINGLADSRTPLDWVDGVAEPTYLLHPLLLDNSSQFVLFYLYEKALSAPALLPFLIESIEYFEDPEQLQPDVSVTATLPTLSERATEAHLEVVSEGRVALKINGINSRRVILSPVWEKFVGHPSTAYLTTPVATSDHLTGRGVIMQAEQSILPEDDVILEWCLDYVLTRAEQGVWRETGKTRKRKLDWLLGRIAAKEAVRKLVHSSFGKALGPHDVEIINNESGVPQVRLSDDGIPKISVSISHTEGVAVALAVLNGDSPSMPGIDAELIREREPSFARTFLKQHELDYLTSCPPEQFSRELTRLWSAKEALFKASGGTIEMSSFTLATEKPGTEIMEMRGGQPEKSVRAYLATKSDLVIAYVV